MADLTLEVDAEHALADEQLRGIEPADADFYLPLNKDEVGTLKMALNLAQIRASQEGDTERQGEIGALFNRVDWNGLLKDSEYEFEAIGIN